MSHDPNLDHLADRELHARLHTELMALRHSTVEILILLGEVDRRRSYLAEGAPSLFAWCTRWLGLSEPEANLRIHSARAARQFPILIEMVRIGALHLSAVGRLAPHLTDANHRELIGAAQHLTCRQLESLLAAFTPRRARGPRIEAVVEVAGPCGDDAAGDGADTRPGTSLTIGFEGSAPGSDDAIAAQCPAGDLAHARKTSPPGPMVDSTHRGEARPAEASVGSRNPHPRTPTVYRLHLTIPQTAMRKLEVLTELMRHQVPDGDPATIIERGLDLLLETVGRQKFGLRKQDRLDLVAGVESSSTIEHNERSDTMADVESGATIERNESSGTMTDVESGATIEHNESSGTKTHVEARDTTNELDGGAAVSAVNVDEAPVAAGTSASLRRRGRIRGSRHIPAAVRRAVRRRDAGRCAFQAPDGRRCDSRAWLEYHHIAPFSRGGPATAENIELRCRSHNQHEARLEFGTRADPRVRGG